MLLSLALLLLSIEIAIRTINLRHLRYHGNEVPSGFEGVIDTTTLSRMSAYAGDTGRLGLASHLVAQALIILALFGGALERYDQWIGHISHSFVIQGVCFFLGVSWCFALTSLPFGMISGFVIEQRFGFNHTTKRLFWADFAKGLLLSTVFILVLTSCGLCLVKWSPQFWWVFVWLLFLVFEVTVTLVAPRLIEPFFMKTTPLEREELAADICTLAKRTGIRVDRVFQVDASRRSGHTNAYFTGLGPVKRVILFDTLLEKLDRSEILAVLAHELGHWKLRHISKSFVMFQALALGAIYGAYRFIDWEGLPNLIGATHCSFPMRVSIAMFTGSLISVCLSPCLKALSRRHEWQADNFACGLVEPTSLASGLVKLAVDNLANLHPHPLYSAYYGSHPTLVARVARLRSREGTFGI